MQCRGPINRLLMMRKRGIGGTFFQRVGASLCAKSVGHWIGMAQGLQVFPVSLSIEIDEGETQDQYLHFSIQATDDEGDQTAWVLAESYTWMSLSSYGGTGLTQITVTIDPDHVDFPGDTSATITASAAGADNSPQDITINISVIAQGEAMLMESGEFILTEGDDNILLE